MSSLSVAEKAQSKGIKMLLVAVLCLGLNWPGMKLGLEIVGPVWMVCLRFLLSLPVLALFVLITKKRLPVLNRKDRSVVFVVAFLLRCHCNTSLLEPLVFSFIQHRFGCYLLIRCGIDSARPQSD